MNESEVDKYVFNAQTGSKNCTLRFDKKNCAFKVTGNFRKMVVQIAMSVLDSVISQVFVYRYQVHNGYLLFTVLLIHSMYLFCYTAQYSF